jgi:HEPN domain-containing protein
MNDFTIELITCHKMRDLANEIVDQLDEDEIFEFIKEIEESVAEFDFTKRLCDLFDEIHQMDLSVKIGEDIAQAADDELAGAVGATNIKYEDVENDPDRDLPAIRKPEDDYLHEWNL